MTLSKLRQGGLRGNSQVRKAATGQGGLSQERRKREEGHRKDIPRTSFYFFSFILSYGGESPYVGQDGLELTIFASIFQRVGITGMSHHNGKG